ncbi:MAG TPA: membrane dipeptidase [Thermoleophilaceae bacterium]|nr:membrane dipeptidase [Thermoleophilaceae bacterium]
MRKVRGRRGLANKARALVLRAASLLFSHRDWWSGYRVTPELLVQGDVGLAMSVLYRPFEEMDFGKPYAAPPASGYFAKLIEDLDAVEAEVQGQDPGTIRLARNLQELDDAAAAGATAIVHCVEGGFHLGDERDEVKGNVAELADRGVAYITLAHLFFRQVGTNSPALPFLSDRAYRRLFPQPRGEGLTERGLAALDAMVEHRVMVDVSHMHPDSLKEAFARLDEIDPQRDVPVIATHAGYRFGKLQYMLDEWTVRKVRERDGVIGLIMAQHQLNDGIRRRKTKDLEASFEVIRRHVDKIREITGSHRHVALGTDFDGFIKPTMGGLENAGDLSLLQAKLQEEYGEDAELIASANAIRVLRKLWS